MRVGRWSPLPLLLSAYCDDLHLLKIGELSIGREKICTENVVVNVKHRIYFRPKRISLDKSTGFLLASDWFIDNRLDLMHDDVTRPVGSIGVVVTLKSKMATCSASSGENSKIIALFNLSESSNKAPDQLLDGPASSEHMSAFGFVRDYNYVPQCTFEPRRHCFTSLCIRSI